MKGHRVWEAPKGRTEGRISHKGALRAKTTQCVKIFMAKMGRVEGGGHIKGSIAIARDSQSGPQTELAREKVAKMCVTKTAIPPE